MKKKNITSDILRRNKSGDRAILDIKNRVSLKKEAIFRFPVKNIISYVLISLTILSYIFGMVNAPGNKGYIFAASSKETERADLEAQLKDLENQITQYEGTVNQYKQQGNSLTSEIKTLNNKIAKINLQIKAITLNLKKLNGDIESTKKNINTTEDDITQKKNSLAGVLQGLYETEQKSAVEQLLANPKLSDFFLDINNLLATQESVRKTLEKIIELKDKLVDQKESLANEVDGISQLKQYQEAQQKLAKQVEQEKNSLLKETKGQESKYQAILNEKKLSAAQIRSRIFELLGGGELSFGDAYKIAKIAQDATGVRAALILAVLDGESALGRNVGKCKYDVNPYYPAKASNKTTMHPKRDIPIFLEILKELNMDPNSVSVSCPIPRDGAFGGAMGPAQFIPSTWELYKDQVAQLTGHNPASPWNNTDAFVATALYLKGAGASAGSSLYEEKVAAARYYAGGNWKTYLNSYGARVVSKAEEFQDDIDVLNGNFAKN